VSEQEQRGGLASEYSGAENAPEVLKEGAEGTEEIQEEILSPTSEVRIHNSLLHLDDDKKDLMVEAFKDSPEAVVNIVTKYGPKLSVDTPQNNKAFYSPYSKKVTIGVFSKNGDPSGAARHEVGHFFDNASGAWLSDAQEIAAAMKSDRDKLRGPGSAKNAMRTAMADAIKKGNKYHDHLAVSDIFSNMSGGKISGSWAHPKGYYTRDPDVWRKENFADIFDIIASNDNEALEFVRGFFPDTVAAVEKVIADG
jgi:hypothetical protein